MKQLISVVKGKKTNYISLWKVFISFLAWRQGVLEAENTRSLEDELQSLQLENERLKREKEDLVQDIKGMTQLLIHFITSSDIDQIRKLPTFVQDCKMELHKLGLYNAQDGKMKIMVDRSGQVMTVTQ